jgi:hypothetical protein
MTKESFNNTQHGHTEYFTVSDGQFVKRVKEPTEASQSRVNKNGVTVHEERYKALTGTIVSAEIRESDYGKDWSFKMVHEGGAYVIQMPYGSRYATDLAKRFRNIRQGEAVRLMPWSLIDDKTGKKRSGLAVYQGGQKLEPFFTRDSAEQLPQLKQVKVSGKMVWDSTELDEAVEQILKGFNVAAIDGGADEPFAETNEEPPF